MSKARKQSNTAEALLRTDNDHWNGYALRFLASVKERELFTDYDQAMVAYQDVIGLATDHHAEPLRADREIAKRLEAFTEDQRRAIYQGALSYLRNSSFDTEEEELDLSPLLAILKGRGNEPELPSWATSTRGRIQELIRKQLEDLPALLEQLEPKDRVAALTRLLPYTMNRGEGDSPTVKKL